MPTLEAGSVVELNDEGSKSPATPQWRSDDVCTAAISVIAE
jgi:hypothetical protein